MTMIVISDILDVDSDDREAFVTLVTEMAHASRAEPGCFRYAFTADLDDPDRFHLIEIWADAPALESHFKTPHFLGYRDQVRTLRIERSMVRFQAEVLPPEAGPKP
jgi:quinol monooxygenase YgiN